MVAYWARIPGTYMHQQLVFWVGPLFCAILVAVIINGMEKNLFDYPFDFLKVFIFIKYRSLKPENFGGAGDINTATFVPCSSA